MHDPEDDDLPGEDDPGDYEDEDEYSLFDEPHEDSPALDPPWWEYR